MFKQNQVLRTVSAPESAARLDAVVADKQLSTRGAIARKLCEVFDFVDGASG